MTRESKYAIFKFKKSDEDLVAELSDYLDQHGHVAFDFFEVDVPEEKILIEILPTKDEYDEKSISQWLFPENHTAQKWGVGEYSSRLGEILLLSPKDYKSTMHYMKDAAYPDLVNHWHKTVVHEFTHYVNALFRTKNNCGNTEKYLSEGIATYLSGQRDGQDVKFDFPIENLMSGEKFSYVASYLVTKYFVEHYDKNYVLEVFQSSRQAQELLKNELYDKAKKFYTEQENS